MAMTLADLIQGFAANPVGGQQQALPADMLRMFAGGAAPGMGAGGGIGSLVPPGFQQVQGPAVPTPTLGDVINPASSAGQFPPPSLPPGQTLGQQAQPTQPVPAAPAQPTAGLSNADLIAAAGGPQPLPLLSSFTQPRVGAPTGAVQLESTAGTPFTSQQRRALEQAGFSIAGNRPLATFIGPELFAGGFG